MENDRSLSISSSPLRSNEKIQPRYLSPHMPSCHDHCKHGKKDEVETEVNSLNFRKFVKERKKLTLAAEKNRAKILENAKSPNHVDVSKLHASDKHENFQVKKSFESDDNNSETKIKKIVSSAVPNATLVKKPPSRIQPQKHKQKISGSIKNVRGEGKTSITLRNKAPIVRSLSKKKSSHSLSLRKKHEIEIKNTFDATLEVIGNESSQENSQGDQNEIANKRLMCSKKDQKNGIKSMKTEENTTSSRMLRKVKSIKRTSSFHGSVMNMQLRKVRSIKKIVASNKHAPSYTLKEAERSKKNAYLEEKIPNVELKKVKSIKKNSLPSEKFQVPQLRKIKSIKKNSLPLDGDSTLQLKKLKSISEKRPSNEADSSSLQICKLKSSKRKSSENESISNMISRKFMSIMRSSSAKGKNKLMKPADVKSNSVVVDLASNIKVEESSSATDVVLNSKKRVPRSKSNHSEDANHAPFKLKFRRGTVINLRSNSINGAKRLWFNIGKLANKEDATGSIGLLRKRSIMKKRGSFGARDFEIHSIVLKHQKTIKKRDDKSLFNDVIEETASKLVETKKSKVKALVGAFETVISLQESKPVSPF